MSSSYAVTDPATGDVVKEFPTISDADLTAAIGRAFDAYQGWARKAPLQERADLIRRVADLHTERREELAEIIVREMGKPMDQALGEVDFAADIYRYYADNAAEILKDETIELTDGDGTAIVRQAPLGVLLGIMPWNFPYYQVARFAGPNVVIGNTVLLKHAGQCPESAAAMEKIFTDAGAKDGVYVNVYASTDQIESVIADPRVQGVSLTGSERAGAAVAQIAGRHLKKVALELGGSDPFILFSTDDLDGAVEAAVAGRIDNNGQSCNAPKRFIIMNNLYDAFVEKFTAAVAAIQPADPRADGTGLGPLSSLSAAEHLQSQLDRAVDQGATLVHGGERKDAFFPPAVLADVTPENDTYYEEFFGPVAMMFKVSSEEEAVRLANDTPFGLGSYVFTTDHEQAMRVADQIDAGMVWVNVTLGDSAELPFGGVKNSGTGRELGRLGATEFVNKKLIRVAG